MPNWCVGTIKVRGKKENIKRWLNDGLGNPVNYMEREEPAGIRISDSGYELDVNIKGEKYCNNTHRNFIQGHSYYYNETFEDDCKFIDNYTLCFDIRAAWGFDPEVWKEISKEFDLAFRLHGFENGMCFEQILEVTSGRILIDKEVKYYDYNWEAYDPRLGG